MNLGRRGPAAVTAGLKHAGFMSSSSSSSSRFAVGRDVEAAQRLGEIGKSENAPLFLQLGAPAVAHNCRQEAPEQCIFVSDMRIHA